MIKRLLALCLVLILLILPLSLTVSGKRDINEAELSLSRSAGAVYLYSYECDRVLLLRDGDSKRAPASSAKIMTGVVACELYSDKIDEDVTISEEMLDGISGASMGLRVGMTLKIRDLLRGTLCGNNDAAQSLAIACAGSVEKFVNDMNFYADHLYMLNTHYTNPTGHDSSSAYTTLSDTAKLVHKAVSSELYLSCSAVQYFEYTPEGEPSVTVYNRNALMSQFSANGYTNKYAKGIIAGSTDLGGYVLATYAEKNGEAYLCLVMGAEADENEIYSYSTANYLLDHVFNSYSYRKVANAGDDFISTEVALAVSNGKSSMLPCVLSEDLYVFIDYGTDLASLKFVPYLHETNMSAPINKDSVVGVVDVYYGEILVGSAELVASEDIEPNFVLYSMKLAKDFLLGRTFIVAAIIFVILLIVYLVIDAKNTRHKRVGRVGWNKFS
ncbi:MAG: D-alanyl-D-alanine carboxypeptidase [Clostridia bacterium]|nr:D-alanyl-D-alanine carboxypeptidase [Clostridia bacterium]